MGLNLSLTTEPLQYGVCRSLVSVIDKPQQMQKHLLVAKVQSLVS